MMLLMLSRDAVIGVVYRCMPLCCLEMLSVMLYRDAVIDAV